MRFLVRTLSACLATLVLCLLSTGSAVAHVLLDSAQPNGDGSVTLTFSFDHGCGTSPTNRLSVTMPEGSAVVSAETPEGWNATIDGQTVTWSGAGIPVEDQAEFAMTARLAGDVGAPLLFPAEQECESGDGYSWTDEKDADPEPAPRLVVTSAVLDPELIAAPDAVPSDGASGREVAVAIVGLAFLAGLAGWWFPRRS